MGKEANSSEIIMAAGSCSAFQEASRLTWVWLLCEESPPQPSKTTGEPPQHHPMKGPRTQSHCLTRAKQLAKTPNLPAQPRESTGAKSGILGSISHWVFQQALQSALGALKPSLKIPDGRLTSCSQARGPQEGLAAVKSRQLQQPVKSPFSHFSRSCSLLTNVFL